MRIPMGVEQNGQGKGVVKTMIVVRGEIASNISFPVTFVIKSK